MIVLAIKKGALEEFHAGTLDSTKCISWSKAALPPLGQYWGMLSNEFVHIGKRHSNFESPSVYTDKDEALSFVISSLWGNVWLLHVVTDLTFSDETHTTRYWRRNGQEARFELTPEMREWTKTFLASDESPIISQT